MYREYIESDINSCGIIVLLFLTIDLQHIDSLNPHDSSNFV